ncbi:MAG: hypothetical protein GY820_28035 [Gammaproteobacteria bacterium]|nr:hypothetical protein [Gammaproteobacteria bacterium]
MTYNNGDKRSELGRERQRIWRVTRFIAELDEAGRCRRPMEIALQARSSGAHLTYSSCMDLRCGVKKNDDRHGKWRSKRGDIRPHNGL